jgi:hypothetical protein
MQAFSDLEIPQRTVTCDCVLHPGDSHTVVGVDRRTGRIERDIENACRFLSPKGLLLQDEIRRWSYKPETWFWIEQLSLVHDAFMAFDSQFALRVISVVPDSYNPGRKIEVVGKHAVPMWIADDPRRAIEAGELGHWLQDTLMEMERHEMREWLKRDGVLHDDPHRTDRQ